MTDPQIPGYKVKESRNFFAGLSPVILVPIAALLIAGGIIYKAISEKGPLIEVTFDQASGIVADQTVLKFREINVGKVEDLHLTEDLKRVTAAIRLDKEVAPYVDADAKFWIVRPEVSARGVTGLDTVLSGVFIQGSWDAKIGESQTEFDGALQAPLVPTGKDGTTITLSAPRGGGLQAGAPILHRGVQVGTIDRPELSKDGSQVTANAFIEAPYDDFLNTASRFWGISGLSVDIKSTGISLNIGSLATLLEGGLEFATFGSGGQLVEPGQNFTVYTSRDAAEEGAVVAEGPGENDVMISTVFSGAVSGLNVNAPVELAGQKIGQVVGLSSFVGEDSYGPSQVLLRVSFAVDLAKLGLPADATEEDALTFFRDAVAQGLKAEMVRRSMLSQDLKIVIRNDPDGAPGSLVENTIHPPQIPSFPVEVADLSASAEGIMEKVAALPIEDVVTSAISLMDSVTALTSSDEMRNVPQSIALLLNDAQSLIGKVDPEPLLGELTALAGDLRQVVQELEASGALASLNAGLTRSDNILSSVEETSRELPQVLANLDQVLMKIEQLAVEDLLTSTTGLSDELAAYVQSEALKGLPDQLAGLTSEARSLLSNPALQKAPDQIGVILDNTGTVTGRLVEANTVGELTDTIEQIEQVGITLNKAAEQLPPILEEFSAVAETAAALPLEQLVARANALVGRAEDILASSDTQDLPASLNATLDQLTTTLGELREGGAVDNTNATLDAARIAAQEFASLSADLPALVTRIDELAANTNSLITAYGDRSDFNTQTVSALRDLKEAARAVTSLARSLERNPNSLILGR